MRLDHDPPTVSPASKTGQPSRRGLLIAGAAGLAVLGVVVVVGLLARSKDSRDVAAWTRAQDIPVVSVVSPSVKAGDQDLVLPGSLQAYYNAQIFARVPGYVHAWFTDIGARVKKGQLLAVIDTPELDQQLIQARAELVSAEAHLKLSSATAERWRRLLAEDAVSRQEAEEKAGDAEVKSAAVNAARANLGRLTALKSFARIQAPFDGLVTARKTDIGALVNAGAGAAPNAELFDVGKVDQLRLYVRTPQAYASRVGPGTKALITVPEHPGETFSAVFSSTANAVSDNSGSVLIELLVDNGDGRLKAGDYAEVTLKTHAPDRATGPALSLPTSALLFTKSGVQAAVVDAALRVRLRRLTVGRDLGSTIEVTSGLSPKDKVVDNPPDSIAEGELVRVVKAPAGPGGPAETK